MGGDFVVATTWGTRKSSTVLVFKHNAKALIFY